jgi:hypothetical protein
VVAELHFPGALVRARVEEYARKARLGGAQHTLQVWREGYREALVALARVATASPANAACESLVWHLDGEDFQVSAAFAQPDAPIVHYRWSKGATRRGPGHRAIARLG